MSLRHLVAVISVLGAVFVSSAQAVTPPYDSVEQKVIDGIIDDGVIYVKPDTLDAVPQIREQLKYMLGQINWMDAAPKLSWFKIQVTKSDEPDADTGMVAVHYSAKGHISWSRGQDWVDKTELILPARGDDDGIGDFVDRYFSACTNDPHADRDGYFFFYYPALSTCPMHSASSAELKREKGMVVRFPMRFQPNQSNTTGKYPEYGKIWEDKKLIATAIFGKYEEAATTDADEGILAYEQFYSYLVNAYGYPSRATPEEHDEDPTRDRFRHTTLTWHWQNGYSFVLNLALISKVSNENESFISWYKKRTQDSDVVIYNGHAGLGDNIEVLSKQAVFTPKKYQIFFINGCDTFTYVNEMLFAAHGAATPGAPVSKYLDIITNSVSNYFSSMASNSFALISALIHGHKTYHQILEGFDSRQRAVVDGEEDNAWPNVFNDDLSSAAPQGPATPVFQGQGQ